MIWSIVPFPVGILPVHLLFLLRYLLGSFPVWSEEAFCLHARWEQLSCNLHTVFWKWNERGKRPLLLCVHYSTLPNWWLHELRTCCLWSVVAILHLFKVLQLCQMMEKHTSWMVKRYLSPMAVWLTYLPCLPKQKLLLLWWAFVDCC